MEIKRKSRLQTICLVTKVIVVRNLLAFAYDGSNPSPPTKSKYLMYLYFFISNFLKRVFMYFPTNKGIGVFNNKKTIV